MTDIDWGKLAEPFPDAEVKSRPGAATWEHKQTCEGRRCRDTRDASKHLQFSYVDARAVAQRLDDVVGPAGWNFTVDVAASDVVKGSLSIGGVVREDIGYPNSDDDAEPYKSAVSDALKRCAVLFGIGRHLYEDNKSGHRPAQNGSGRPAPRPVPIRPATAPASVPDDPYGDLLDLPDGTPFIAPANFPQGDQSTCELHGEPWRGEPGDLYHKKAEGGYCRHPDNVQKVRAAR